ncbi:Peptidoglycan D,D-transpeptidase MrdA [Streptomyces badius]
MKPKDVRDKVRLCDSKTPQPCWNGSPYQQIPVTDEATTQQALQIRERAEDFPGITAEPTAVRRYAAPGKAKTAQVLGYLSPVTDDEIKQAQDGPSPYLRSDQVGRSGIERTYDKELRGKAGVTRYEVDNLGRVMGEAEDDPAVAGATLVTSLDARVQAVAEYELAAAMKRVRGETDKITGRKYEADRPRRQDRPGQAQGQREAPGRRPDHQGPRQGAALRGRAGRHRRLAVRRLAAGQDPDARQDRHRPGVRQADHRLVRDLHRRLHHRHDDLPGRHRLRLLRARRPQDLRRALRPRLRRQPGSEAGPAAQAPEGPAEDPVRRLDPRAEDQALRPHSGHARGAAGRTGTPGLPLPPGGQPGLTGSPASTGRQP